MFYKLTLKDFVRIEPKNFGLPLESEVLKELNREPTK